MHKKRVLDTDYTFDQDWISDIQDDADAAFWDEFFFHEDLSLAEPNIITITITDHFGRTHSLHLTAISTSVHTIIA